MKLCGFDAGLEHPLFLIAGPCVVESEQLQVDTAGTLKEITASLGMPFIFKSSFDKANRSSGDSFRGLGMEEGLRILGEVRRQVGVPVLTDVHEYTPFDEVASVVDVLQTPAFLCRQTDFIRKVAEAGKPVNIKKGQFLAPWDMKNVVDKARATGNEQILVCERGVSFGYNNLVSDMRSLAVMRETGCPVVFDATHSVQLPGGQGTKSGGQREFVPVLARAAIAAGVCRTVRRDPSRPGQGAQRRSQRLAAGTHARTAGNPDGAGRGDQEAGIFGTRARQRTDLAAIVFTKGGGTSMNEVGSNPASDVQVRSSHSGMGIAAFVIGLLTLLGLALALASLVAAIKASGGHLDSHGAAAVGAGLLLLLVGLLALVGTGLGIAGVVQRMQRRLFAILGLCFNAPVVLLILLFLVIGLLKK